MCQTQLQKPQKAHANQVIMHMGLGHLWVSLPKGHVPRHRLNEGVALHAWALVCPHMEHDTLHW